MDALVSFCSAYVLHDLSQTSPDPSSRLVSSQGMPDTRSILDLGKGLKMPCTRYYPRTSFLPSFRSPSRQGPESLRARLDGSLFLDNLPSPLLLHYGTLTSFNMPAQILVCQLVLADPWHHASRFFRKTAPSLLICQPNPSWVVVSNLSDLKGPSSWWFPFWPDLSTWYTLWGALPGSPHRCL